MERHIPNKRYDHVVGHWLREDAAGSLPTAKEWWLLKRFLGFDGTNDDAMTQFDEALQEVKNHPKGKNPGDTWFPCLEDDSWFINTARHDTSISPCSLWKSLREPLNVAARPMGLS
jgi:hypothetical protein